MPIITILLLTQWYGTAQQTTRSILVFIFVRILEKSVVAKMDKVTKKTAAMFLLSLH